MGASMSIEGSADGEALLLYVERLLCPTLERGQVMVMKTAPGTNWAGQSRPARFTGGRPSLFLARAKRLIDGARHRPTRPDSSHCQHLAHWVYRLVCEPLPYSSARAATSSRQKSGISGTTRPQTRWRGGSGVPSTPLRGILR